MALVHRQGLAGGEEILTSSALRAAVEPPPGGWYAWVIKGDRATGKTFNGARWLLGQALAAPEGSLWGVCAPTWLMARYSLEALLAQADPGDVENYGVARLEVTLRNKVRIRGFPAESPDSIRGCNLAGAWFDNADGMRNYSFYRDGLMPALRGKSARLVVTGPLENRWGLLRDLEDEAGDGTGGVHVTCL